MIVPLSRSRAAPAAAHRFPFGLDRVGELHGPDIGEHHAFRAGRPDRHEARR
jgi:hypothetical protein